MYALGWDITALLAVIIIIIIYNNISVTCSVCESFICIDDIYDLRTGQVVPAVRLQTCVMRSPGSNHGRDASYPGWGLHRLTQYRHANAMIVPKIGHGVIISNPAQLSFHHVSCRSTERSLVAGNVWYPRGEQRSWLQSCKNNKEEENDVILFKDSMRL